MKYINFKFNLEFQDWVFLTTQILALSFIVSACSSPTKPSAEAVKTVGVNNPVPASNNSTTGQVSKPITRGEYLAQVNAKKNAEAAERNRRQAVINKFQAVCTPIYSGNESYPFKLCPDSFYVELHNLVPPKKLGQTIPHSYEKNKAMVFLGTKINEPSVMKFRVIGEDDFVEYMSIIGIKLKTGVSRDEFTSKWSNYKFGGIPGYITLRITPDETLDIYKLLLNDPSVIEVTLMPVGRPAEPA